MKIKRQAINPGRTNKLLYPVLAGLVVVFSLFIWLLLRQPGNGSASLARESAYLKNSPGILELLVEQENKRVILVYDPNQKGNYTAMARFAAIRISSRAGEVEVLLARRSPDNPDYIARAKNGSLIEEKELDGSRETLSP